MIERMFINIWYTMSEKTPPEDISLLVTFSGTHGNTEYIRVLGIGMYYERGGWMIDGVPEDAEIEVHAWSDVEPYASSPLECVGDTDNPYQE